MKHWYGRVLDEDQPTGVVQVDGPLLQRRVQCLPEPILRRAHEEYARQHPGQDFERIQERGGFGLVEIIGLLADALGVEPLADHTEGET